MDEVRPMQTTQEVGAAPRVDGTRVSAAGDAINAANCKKETPTAKSAAFGDEPWKSSSEKDQRRAPYRTPSPEYVDAVQDPEQVNQGEAMGETTKPGDTNEVKVLEQELWRRLASIQLSNTYADFSLPHSSLAYKTGRIGLAIHNTRVTS